MKDKNLFGIKNTENSLQENSLEPTQAINEIIRFSTIPGTSRHHWGTEIDIIDENYSDEM